MKVAQVHRVHTAINYEETNVNEYTPRFKKILSSQSLLKGVKNEKIT